MNVNPLNTAIRVEDIDFRVQSVIKSGETVWAIILPYKDARYDMDMLDNLVGYMDWKKEYKEINGALFCGISIWDKEKKEWVTKWDSGEQGQGDGIKSTASDAAKRAAFAWGIGRKIYNLPKIFVKLLEGEFYEKDKKIYPGRSFRPNDWQWSLTNDDKGNPVKLEAYQKVKGKNETIKRF